MRDSFATLRQLTDEVWFHSLPALGDALGKNLDRLPRRSRWCRGSRRGAKPSGCAMAGFCRTS
jgi:hypothetical protein